MSWYDMMCYTLVVGSMICQRGVIQTKRERYNGQVRIERILVLGAHNLIQIVCSRVSRRDLRVFLKDRDIGVALLEEMQGSGETESAGADDGYGG